MAPGGNALAQRQDRGDHDTSRVRHRSAMQIVHFEHVREAPELESPAARPLRDKAFRSQFEGLTLADFYKHDYYAAADPGTKADKVAAIKPPQLDPAGRPDYDATLRGLRKNLILLDFFVFGRRFEPYFERSKAAQKAKAGKG